MSFTQITAADSGLQRLIAQGIAKFGVYPIDAERRWLLVDVITQRLVLVQGPNPVGAWPVSTAAVGLDNRQDSGGTPPGAHRIARKIGAGSAAGTIFVSRQPTGEIWHQGQNTPDDLILTRILTLDGCEPGINQGAGVDSRERHIYLHGTNDEDHIGEPTSHGCVRLNNTDICDVFERIEEGDPVVII